MAVAYRSLGQVTWGSSTSCNIPKPSGLTEGDLMVAYLAAEYGQGDWSKPSGWTTLRETDSNPIHSAVIWKIASAGDVAASTFNFTNTGGGLCAGHIMAFSGTDQTSPITADSVANGISDNPTSGTITPSANNIILLLSVIGNDVLSSGYAIANDNPSWTEAFDINTTSGMDYATAGAYSAVRSASTATGNGSSTVTPVSPYWICNMVAIQPPIPVSSNTGSFFQFL